MSHTPDQILAAATAIQPEIPNLLDDQIALGFKTELLSLIERVNTGQANSLDLKDHLTNVPETRQWFLKNFPPKTEDELKIYNPLPGQGNAIEYPRYKCPDCGDLWSQIEPSDPIPACSINPNHAALQLLQP